MTKTVDSFAGTAGTQLQNHTPDSGGPWVQQSGDAGACELNGSGYLEHAATTNADACYTVDTGDADHYAQCVFGTAAPAAAIFEVCVRCANASNFYGAWGAGSGHVYQVYKRVAGSFTSLYTSSVVAKSGDIVKLTITGSVLQLWVNGTQLGSDITDAALSGTTTAGIVPHNAGAVNPLLTSWESDANGSGGIQHTQSLSASFTAGAVIVRRTGKKLNASFSAQASLTRRVGKKLSAAFTAAAVVTRRVSKHVSAAFAANGHLTRRISKKFSAAFTLAGALGKNVSSAGSHLLTLTASFTANGALTRCVGKILPASINFQGLLSTFATHQWVKQTVGAASWVAKAVGSAVWTPVATATANWTRKY